MSTNESFIKAYRRDAALPATPPPARVRPAAQQLKAAAPASPAFTSHPAVTTVPALHSISALENTVAIAVATYAPATTIVATTFETHRFETHRFDAADRAEPTRPTLKPTAPIARPTIVPPTPVPHPSTPIRQSSPTTPIRSTPPTSIPHSTAAPAAKPAPPQPTAPIIGKRPLSAFQATQPSQTPPQRVASAPSGPTIFTPETVISAFRWPSVCRTLWEEYAIEYEHVAEKLVEVCRAGRPIVGVTGINTGDGCTTTLLCLAVALAARKMRLALVDASFHDPQLAELLGAKVNTSWSTVLDQELPVAEAMIRATDDHIDLLPLDGRQRLAGHEAADLVAKMQTSVTAGVLRSSYDIVLVDLGALLAPGAYATLSNLLRMMPIESAVVVANPRTADADDAAVVGELLEEDGCELLGVIENRAKPLAARLHVD